MEGAQLNAALELDPRVNEDLVLNTVMGNFLARQL